jgi:hypothetical protein
MDHPYPMMLYRFPAQGPMPVRLEDGAYDTCTVDDEDAQAAAEADGWHTVWTAARQAHAAMAAPAGTAPAAVLEIDPVDPADPPPKPVAKSVHHGLSARQALEAQAKELGLKFHPRLGDKKLAEMIAAAKD